MASWPSGPRKHQKHRYLPHRALFETTGGTRRHRDHSKALEDAGKATPGSETPGTPERPRRVRKHRKHRKGHAGFGNNDNTGFEEAPEAPLEITVRSYCSKLLLEVPGLCNTELCSTPLCSAWPPCMYMHRFTLVYIYIYILYMYIYIYICIYIYI